jgi:hypothetical protein
MKTLSYTFILFLISLVSFSACSDEGPLGTDADDFDRRAMLVNWADNLVIPAYENFVDDAGALDAAAGTFAGNPSLTALESLRSAFESAYLSFQTISMYEIGPAMLGSQGVSVRNLMNSYPASTEQILENITLSDVNFDLPSQYDAQGFPALDYLLYGAGGDDAAILALYTEGNEAESYRSYLQSLTTRILTLGEIIRTEWTTGYRDEFVENSGNGGNASIDMMVNDYIFYYEKWLRAGKIGIPAGVFSGTPLPTHVEAFYHGNFSRDLALKALDAAQDFFNGVHFDGAGSGESLKSYLDYLDSERDDSELSALINNQFESARDNIEALQHDFSAQVETDNTAMLNAYDELQRNVVYLKVDMLQALNISVDYVDADGD